MIHIPAITELTICLSENLTNLQTKNRLCKDFEKMFPGFLSGAFSKGTPPFF
jgi:hypothetical protein